MFVRLVTERPIPIGDHSMQEYYAEEFAVTGAAYKWAFGGGVTKTFVPHLRLTSANSGYTNNRARRIDLLPPYNINFFAEMLVTSTCNFDFCWRFIDGNNNYGLRVIYTGSYSVYKRVASVDTTFSTSLGSPDFHSEWRRLSIAHIGQRVSVWVDGTAIPACTDVAVGIDPTLDAPGAALLPHMGWRVESGGAFQAQYLAIAPR